MKRAKLATDEDEARIASKLSETMTEAGKLLEQIEQTKTEVLTRRTLLRISLVELETAIAKEALYGPQSERLRKSWGATVVRKREAATAADLALKDLLKKLAGMMSRAERLSGELA